MLSIISHMVIFVKRSSVGHSSSKSQVILLIHYNYFHTPYRMGYQSGSSMRIVIADIYQKHGELATATENGDIHRKTPTSTEKVIREGTRGAKSGAEVGKR